MADWPSRRRRWSPEVQPLDVAGATGHLTGTVIQAAADHLPCPPGSSASGLRRHVFPEWSPVAHGCRRRRRFAFCCGPSAADTGRTEPQRHERPNMANKISYQWAGQARTGWKTFFSKIFIWPPQLFVKVWFVLVNRKNGFLFLLQILKPFEFDPWTIDSWQI